MIFLSPPPKADTPGGGRVPYLARSLFLISVRCSLPAVTLDDRMTFVILTFVSMGLGRTICSTLNPTWKYL